MTSKGQLPEKDAPFPRARDGGTGLRVPGSPADQKTQYSGCLSCPREMNFLMSQTSGPEKASFFLEIARALGCHCRKTAIRSKHPAYL